jgi:hypothetical protein
VISLYHFKCREWEFRKLLTLNVILRWLRRFGSRDGVFGWLLSLHWLARWPLVLHKEHTGTRRLRRTWPCSPCHYCNQFYVYQVVNSLLHTDSLPAALWWLLSAGVGHSSGDNCGGLVWLLSVELVDSAADSGVEALRWNEYNFSVF